LQSLTSYLLSQHAAQQIYAISQKAKDCRLVCQNLSMALGELEQEAGQQYMQHLDAVKSHHRLGQAAGDHELGHDSDVWEDQQAAPCSVVGDAVTDQAGSRDFSSKMMSWGEYMTEDLMDAGGVEDELLLVSVTT
jgi:hypothetical protein